MMLFSFHIAYALELLALVSGVGLFVFLKTHPGKFKKGWSYFVAWVVIIISSLTIICTSVQVIVFWSQGYYKHPMMWHKYMHKKMMDDYMDRDMHDGH